MANRYVSSVLWSAVTAWAAGAAVTLGTIRRQLATPTQGNERCWRCTTAGTTGGAEPSWTLTANSTTNDNGVVWTECTGQETYNPAGNWTAPHATFDHAHSFASSGDVIFMDKNHTETWNAATKNYTKSLTVQVVTVAGSTQPPTAEHAATGAVLTYTGSNGYPTFGGTWHIHGVSFQIGSASNTVYFQVASLPGGSGIVTLQNCAIALNTTNGSSHIWCGQGTANRGILTLINTPITFGAAGQGFWTSTMNSAFLWMDTPNAIGGTSPSNLFKNTGSMWAQAELIGLDLTNLTGNIVDTAGGGFGGNVLVSGCKLSTSTLLAASVRTQTRGARLQMVNSDSATGNSLIRSCHGTPCSALGWLSTTSLYRAGGAALNGTGYCLSMLADPTTSVSATYAIHPVSPGMPLWFAGSGVSKTVTFHVLADKAALPTNNMLWLEARYLGSSTSPVTSAAGAPAAVAKGSPTNLTATTQDWGASVTARANSTAYTRGQMISVSSNATRVFFCTTAGTSSGSLPAGYASAVDGGSVTDGTAVFRAGYRVSLSITFTPQREGWWELFLHYLDNQTTNQNTAIYLDPLPEVA